MRNLLFVVVAFAACAAPQRVSAPAPARASAAASAPDTRTVEVALFVQDTTDARARLASALEAALRAVGVHSRLTIVSKQSRPWDADAAVARKNQLPYIIRVAVVSRRGVSSASHVRDTTTQPAFGVGFSGADPAPDGFPELQDVVGTQAVDVGVSVTQEDLRLDVMASVRATEHPSVPLKRWTLTEGSLLRLDSTAHNEHEWHAVYSEIASRLAKMIADKLGVAQ